jgi:hypothetical protein
MLPVNLGDLTPDHVQDLINSEVAENLTLEYKAELPSDQSEQKREFLYDVAAMANAAGGDIIFGIADRRGEDNQSTGVADSIAGMKLGNEQAVRSRLESLIRDGVAPRLAGVSMRGVACPDGDVLVIRVPRSWDKPHMVTMGGVNRFCGRVSTGKYPMSVDEIGRAFSEQSELRERISKWRAQRAALIESRNAPAQLGGEVVMLFHTIPADGFSGNTLHSSWRIPEEDKNHVYVPCGARTPRYNADGFICTSAYLTHPGGVFGYTQLFRSGVSEYADSYSYRAQPGMVGDVILGRYLEKEMVFCYQDAINRLRRNGQTGSLYVGFSLLGILGKTLYGTTTTTVDMPPIQTNVFSSPEVLVDMSEQEGAPFSRTLLPLVDTLWQVGGRETTPFKPNGVWDPFTQWM